MERNVQRINGVKLHLHELSESELCGAIGAAYERLESTSVDLQVLQSELTSRNNTELPLGRLAVGRFGLTGDGE